MSDEKYHTLVLWGQGDSEEKELRARFRSSDMRFLGLSSVEDLDNVDLPGRGARLGLVVPTSTLFGADRKWELPLDMWGETYIVLDVTPRYDLRSAITPEMVNMISEPLSVPLFFLDVLHPGTTDATSFASLSTDGMPKVNLATTLFDTAPRRRGIQGYAAGLASSPNLSVVDCHGVIRWHGSAEFIVTHSLEKSMAAAIDVANRLENEKKSGACWDAS
ncbi:MAG: hypothetical protein HC927_06265 [Deltaproteobacteria bacterium]|nr:hypothetical protein [Deltaproteobacteria bacterium]